jgi:hypothetical protein
MEDIRLDEGAVLKTAGDNTLRGSSPWSSALFVIVLWPSGEGTWFTPSRSTVRVCPGLLVENGATPLGAGHVCKTCWIEFESQWRLLKNGVVRQRLSGLS